MKRLFTFIILIILPLFSQCQVLMMKAYKISSKLGDQPYSEWQDCNIPVRFNIDKNEIKIWSTDTPVTLFLTSKVNVDSTSYQIKYELLAVDNAGRECEVEYGFITRGSIDDHIFINITYPQIKMTFRYKLYQIE